MSEKRKASENIDKDHERKKIKGKEKFIYEDNNETEAMLAEIQDALLLQSRKEATAISISTGCQINFE